MIWPYIDTLQLFGKFQGQSLSISVFIPIKRVILWVKKGNKCQMEVHADHLHADTGVNNSFCCLLMKESKETGRQFLNTSLSRCRALRMGTIKVASRE